MCRLRLAPFALLSLCVLTAIVLSGCTAICFTAGALQDMSKGKGPPARLAPVRTGTYITLWLNDGRKLQGEYLGSADSLSETPPPVPPSGGERSLVPLRAVLLIGTHHGVQQVPTQSVTRVSVPVARGKVTGLLGGLALDTLMILLFIAALSQMNFS